MHHRLVHPGAAASFCPVLRRPAPCVAAGCVSRPARTHRRSLLAAASASPGPSTAAPEPEQGPPAQQSPAPEVVEASRVTERGQQGAEDAFEEEEDLGVPGLPVLPVEVVQTARTAYLALSGVLLLQGLGMAAAAQLAPAALLPAICTTPATVGLATTLLGCAAAGPLLASALSLHLAGTAAEGELGTWRHQRINGALAAYFVVTLLAALWVALPSHPLLTGVAALTSAAGAVACALVARACWAHGPWLQWSLEPGDVSATSRILLSYLRRDLSTVAGVACLLLLAVTATGATGVLLSPVSWGLDATASSTLSRLGFHPWLPYGTQDAQATVLEGLRLAGGAALLLWAVVAHALLEAAVWARGEDLVGYVKANLVALMQEDDPAARLLSPGRARFAALNALGVLLAGGAQAAALARGAALGLEALNRDAALMGPLHWSCMLAAVYLVVNNAALDWSWVAAVARGAFGAVMGAVELVLRTFMLPSQWLSR